MDDIQLVMKVDTAPVDRAVRVMDNLEAELRDVERAMDKGLITERQFNAETARLKNSMTQLNRVAKGSAKDFRAFEKRIYGSGKALRAKEMQMQQAGYQLQDFIVQVQSGTNPLIAFSQQGSQLAGFFAGPWGAAIGLGIAALGGLGTALLGTSGKTDDFATSLDKASDAISEWKDAVDAANEPTKSLEDRFGGLSDYVYRARQQVAEFRKEIAQMRFDNALDKLMSDYVSQRGAGARGQRIAKQFDLGREFMVSLKKETRSSVRREANTIVSQLNFLQTGEGRDDPEMQAYALDQIINAMTTLAQMKDGISESEAEIIDHFMSQRDLIFQMNELTNDQITKTKERGDLLTQIQTDAMAMEAELAAEAKTAQSDAVRVRAALEAKFTARRIAEEEKVAKVKNGLTATSLTNATKANADRIQKEIDAENIRQALEDTFRQRTADAKEVAANNYHNGMIARQTAYYDRERRLAKEAFDNALTVLNVAHTPSMIATLAKYAGRGTVDNREPIFGNSGESIYDEGKTKGKTPAQQLDEYMKGLERTVKLEQKQVGVSEEVARTLELREEYEKRGLKVNESRIEALVKEEEALRKATQAEEMRKQQIDTISNQMEAAFMAMVDGSKSVGDAFRDLVRQMLMDALQQKVVSPFVSAIMGGFKADGGPVQAGRTYMVGERGPELFTAPTNGNIVPNHELGGGKVTVNQTINVSTGVQQTVRTEIKSLMPQIAEASKAAVVDAKRRGGSYGRNFA